MEKEAESRARDLKAAEEGGNGGTEARSPRIQREGPAAKVMKTWISTLERRDLECPSKIVWRPTVSNRVTSNSNNHENQENHENVSQDSEIINSLIQKNIWIHFLKWVRHASVHGAVWSIK